MSPLPDFLRPKVPPVTPVSQPSTPPTPAVTPAPVTSQRATVADETPATVPAVIMSTRDAYITERLREQPKTLEEIERDVTVTTDAANRLALPPYFERLSFDCSVGTACKAHQWVFHPSPTPGFPGQWLYQQTGKYVFRWGRSDKRGLDSALNIRGWSIVNRASLFRDAPRHLFSANGGVENGDAILLFMPVKKALALRKAPGDRSREWLASRMTTRKDGRVVMANADALATNPTLYEPEMSDIERETTEAPAGA